MILQPVANVGSGGGTSGRWDRPLAGVKNGSNPYFTTPEKFVADPPIRLHVSGRRLLQGRDFTIEESGGPGTGYDRVILLFPVGKLPKTDDDLVADYTERLT